jgi:hypothetical protein
MSPEFSPFDTQAEFTGRRSKIRTPALPLASSDYIKYAPTDKPLTAYSACFAGIIRRFDVI